MPLVLPDSPHIRGAAQQFFVHIVPLSGAGFSKLSTLPRKLPRYRGNQAHRAVPRADGRRRDESAPEEIGLQDSFLKPKHTIRELFIHLLFGIRIVGIGMVRIEKLDDMETAAIHIEMDVPLLKVWRDSFP